jgi:hypothetical protein
VRQYHAIAPHALAQQAEPRWRPSLTVAGMAERGPRPVAPVTTARQRCLARRAGATRRVTFWLGRPISFLSLSYSRSPIPAHEPARRRRLATTPRPPPPRLLPVRRPSLSLSLSISLRSCSAHGGIGRGLFGLPRPWCLGAVAPPVGFPSPASGRPSSVECSTLPG